jgi:WD40 repeat protein
MIKNNFLVSSYQNSPKASIGEILESKGYYFETHKNPIDFLLFLEDSILLTTSKDAILIWDLETYSILASLKELQNRYFQTVNCTKKFIFFVYEREIILYNQTSFLFQRSLTFSVLIEIVFIPHDSNYIYLSSQDKFNVGRYNYDTFIYEDLNLLDKDASGRILAVAEDESLLIYEQRQLKWTMNGFKNDPEIIGFSLQQSAKIFSLKNHYSVVVGILANENKFLITGDYFGLICVWCLELGNVVMRFNQLKSWVKGLIFQNNTIYAISKGSRIFENRFTIKWSYFPIS